MDFGFPKKKTKETACFSTPSPRNECFLSTQMDIAGEGERESKRKGKGKGKRKKKR